MLTDVDIKRLKKAWRAADKERRTVVASLGTWRHSALGALAGDLAPLLERFCGRSIATGYRAEFFDECSLTDWTGEEVVVAMMLSAAIERIGPTDTGRIFAALTSATDLDLVALMRELDRTHGSDRVKKAIGKARQVGERQTNSARMVYILTEVAVLGQINPRTYSYHPGIERSDVFKIMDNKKWFLNQGAPFKAPRATLATYHARIRRKIAASTGEASIVATLIAMNLNWLSSESVPPERQRWPRRELNDDE